MNIDPRHKPAWDRRSVREYLDEQEIFEKFSPKLIACIYGSYDYNQYMDEMNAALQALKESYE